MNKNPYNNFRRYIHLDRWVSYWHQIDESLDLEIKQVLEIGIGNKVVSDSLEKEGIEVQTMDIDKELKPNIAGSAENILLKNGSVDLILCAEVLEHLPFKKFEQCLGELKRVTKKYVVLSLPHFGPPVKISFKIPFLKEIKIAFKIPWPISHKLGGPHYWEIGKRGYSSRKIRKKIKKYFRIKKEFIPFENQYHHFYILCKK